ncbi:MAG: hypothetical protein GY909_17185 [Oligoflexia bacterium]|nr:hypothetical protein [Oligoflexia bacterium]
MNKLIMLFALLLNFQVMALEFERVDIDNLNLSFDGRSGSANLTAGHYKTSKFAFALGASEAYMAKESNLLHLQYQSLDFHLDLEQGGLLDSLGKVDVDGLSLELIPGQKLALFSNRISAEIGDGVQDFNNISVECANRSRSQLYTDYLLPCLTLGRVTLPELKLDSLSSFTVAKALETEEENSVQGIDKIENIKLNIINNRYMLTFKAKFIFKLKITASGGANFNSETSELTLSLEKAKAGIFSVRSKILKEIKKAKIKNVRVEGRNIIIKL